MSWPYLVGGAVLMLLSAGGALWARQHLARARIRRRFARGRAGEGEAAHLLRRHGFVICDEQPVLETGLWVDEEWQPVTVRADFIASRAGKRYVVEAKTGKSAPNPTSPTTRRQLFEYAHVFAVDGLILADMEQGRLLRIRFSPRPDRRPGWRRYGLFLFALLVTLLAGIWLGKYLSGIG